MYKHRICYRVNYIALPMLPDGVTAQSTFKLLLSFPNSSITVSRLSYVLHQYNIPFQVILQDHINIVIEFSFWRTVVSMIEDHNWEVMESSTPLFILELLDYFEHQKTQVTWEDIREKVTYDIFESLHPYQQTLVKLAVERRNLYIADEMGTGKTFSSLAIMKYWELPTVIITMKNIMYNWVDEMQKRIGLIEKKHVFVLKSSASLLKFFETEKEHLKVVVIPFGILKNAEVRAKLQGWAKMMIADESHLVKNETSQRTQATLDLSKHMEVRLVLSGSPFEKSKEIYSQLEILFPSQVPKFFHYDHRKDISSREDFASRYCKPRRVLYRGVGYKWEFKGNDNPDELKVLVSQFMVRRLKVDVCKQLPAKTRHRILLNPVTGSDQGKIKDLLKQMTSHIQVIDRSKYTEAVELTCELKLPEVIRYLHEHVSKKAIHEKIVIFFHHMTMKNALMEWCNEKEISYIMIDGSIGAKQRHELQTIFQAEESCRIALLSIKASGTGTNFTAASQVYMTEVLPTAADMFQAEDRCHRIGQKNPVDIHYLVLPESVDETHVSMIIRKYETSSTIMDYESQTVTISRKRKLESSSLEQFTTISDHEE